MMNGREFQFVTDALFLLLGLDWIEHGDERHARELLVIRNGDILRLLEGSLKCRELG